MMSVSLFSYFMAVYMLQSFLHTSLSSYYPCVLVLVQLQYNLDFIETGHFYNRDNLPDS